MSKMMSQIALAIRATSVMTIIVLTACSSSSADFPSREELESADIESGEDLREFLGCLGVGSFHHQSVTNSHDALDIAREYTDEMPEMAGHNELAEAIPVDQRLWAIADSDGRMVGSVEDGQMIFVCEKKPLDWTEPTVRYLNPGEGGDE